MSNEENYYEIEFDLGSGRIHKILTKAETYGQAIDKSLHSNQELELAPNHTQPFWTIKINIARMRILL